MGLLTSAAQVLYGTKTFANDVVIKGKLRLEGEITRTARASFKLDKSGTATPIGIPHKITPVAVVSAADPAVTTDITVPCAAYVPEGTKAVAGYVQMRSATTAGRAISIKDRSGNTYAVTQNPTTAIFGWTWFVVPLNSSYEFAYAVDNADVSTVYIFVCLVYL
jgi:hypothetical protein